MKYHTLGSSERLERQLEVRVAFPNICFFKTDFKSYKDVVSQNYWVWSRTVCTITPCLAK